MKWLALIAFLIALISTPANARINTPPNESDPALVEFYITLPCQFLINAHRFQEGEIDHLSERYVKCSDWMAEKQVANGEYLCLYVRMQYQLMYTHMKSLEKAFGLVCYDDGHRKNPEYEIKY